MGGSAGRLFKVIVVAIALAWGALYLPSKSVLIWEEAFDPFANSATEAKFAGQFVNFHCTYFTGTRLVERDSRDPIGCKRTDDIK